MTAPAVLGTVQARRPRHTVTGAVTLFGCGSCHEAVTPCTMNRGACVGNGYVHVRTRLHKCAGRPTSAWPMFLVVAA